MMAGWWRGIQRSLERMGVAVHKYPADRTLVILRRGLLQELAVDVVWDIGASDGKYGDELRKGGYRGWIISCEPLRVSFQKLQGRCLQDGRWRCFEVAAGRVEGDATLHVSGNRDSSSLLEMRPRHLEAAPASKWEEEQRVKVVPLDWLLNEVGDLGPTQAMKLDVQGFEKEVLEGAPKILERVRLLEVELSLVPLYVGQALFPEVHTWLLNRGFGLRWIEPGFTDHKRGEILQVECLYSRENS